MNEHFWSNSYNILQWNTDFYDNNLICICNFETTIIYWEETGSFLCVRTFDDGKGEGNGEQNLKELLSQQ